VNYKPTEEQLKEWGEKVLDSIVGFTKYDFEPLFEKYILPFYYLQCSGAEVKTKWKITERSKGNEYSRDYAQDRVKELLNWD
jgi:hypothetical protein